MQPSDALGVKLGHRRVSSYVWLGWSSSQYWHILLRRNCSDVSPIAEDMHHFPYSHLSQIQASRIHGWILVNGTLISLSQNPNNWVSMARPPLRRSGSIGGILRYIVNLHRGESTSSWFVKQAARGCWYWATLTPESTLQPDENAPERPPSAYVLFSNSRSTGRAVVSHLIPHTAQP